MIDANSRYAQTETGTLSIAVDGAPRTIRYVRRRFVPPTSGMTTLLRHAVKQGDRLDNIAAFYFTDATQFWRVCDANGALNPDELVDTVGRTLAIVLPLR